ncbi:MAG: HAMP domain-containing histidine kinase [Erysipelotrichaceae bacterium]|nr:HAMP domain-containing histidine kinase [Erysipelotrichaceae bacterium]
MKKFFKTIAGKTVLFLLCLISMCLFAASMLGIFFYYEEDFYTTDKETMEKGYISSRIRNDLYPYVFDATLYDDDDHILEVEDVGNLVFVIKNEENKELMKSQSAEKISSWPYSYQFRVVYDEAGNAAEVYYSSSSFIQNNEKIFSADAYIRSNTGIQDFYSIESRFFSLIYDMRYGVYGLLGTSLLVMIVTFIALMCVSGRRNESDGLYPGPLHKIPFDLLIALWLGVFVLVIYMIDQIFQRDFLQIGAVLVVMLGFVASFLGLCMSAAVRIKNKDLFTGSFTYIFLKKSVELLRYVLKLIGRVLKWFIEIVSSIPASWKILGIFCLCSFAELFFFYEGGGGPVLLVKLLEFVLLAYIGFCLNKLRKGADALACGDLSYHVDTDKMVWDLKKHGEDLNSIASGMAIAVEDRLKSERMKTELITNVSHDIKTPLTSIINYADLIGKEEASSDKVKEYSEVLIRQSKRLKRLLEDLVEASKAASGSLEVELSPCDANIFIEQCIGEYDDRLKKADLTLIAKKAEERVEILADPRRMWRIFDNLMNNICKYALPGTRVYLSLEKERDKAVISFKNTSKDQLNISPDELLERFKRGDASRNSEGNGLGLSIAKSLTELQNGELDLSIDGDLFKASLRFPLL